MRTILPRILLFINLALLPGHFLMERAKGDLNWLRLGNRSPASEAYILTEGTAALVLVAVIFACFYPNMRALFTSKLTLASSIVLGVEIAVWFSYK